MAIKFNRSQTFATGGTVTSAALHNLVDGTDIYAALITDQPNLSTVSTADKLLIADTDDSVNAKSVTVQELFDDALSSGTYSNIQLSGVISHGTSTGNRTISTSASITTGTINNATLGTTTGTAASFTSGTLTSGIIPSGTFGTTTSTAATITSGTIPTLTAGTTTATAESITNGTIQNLTSSTASITRLSTTLAGDVTISQGTATLVTSGVAAGTYGTSSIVPTISVDSKGRVTAISTSPVSFTPANSSITPSMLSQPLTLATSVASTSGTAIDFTGIPSWAKRITVILNGVSGSGSSGRLIQIGTSSGIDATGYVAYGGGGGLSVLSSTSGFILYNGNAADTNFGHVLITNISGNIWVSSHCGGLTGSGANYFFAGGGNKTLSGTLDRLRITHVTNTETFDAGSINIIYEG